MRGSSLTIILSIVSTLCLAQPMRRVVDKHSMMGISFATIKILHAPYGKISDEEGRFKLNIKEEDSVLFSCVGYKTSICIGKDLDSVIVLEPVIKTLSNVVLPNHFVLGSFIVGEPGIPNDLEYFGHSYDDHREEFGQRLELPDSNANYWIKELVLPVKKIVCKGPLLVHIYSEDPVNNLPGEELFMKKVEADSKLLKARKILIKIQDENIIIQKAKAFYVSISWPEEAYDTDCITVLAISEKSKQVSFQRSILFPEYSWYPFLTMTSYSTGKTSHYSTVFSAKVDQVK